MAIIALKFFRSADGAPRAEGRGDAMRVLANFLESDLQDDAILARELLDRLAKPVDADDQMDAFIGNAFAVTLDGDTITLAGHAEGNDRTALLTLDDLQQAVDDWLSFISE